MKCHAYWLDVYYTTDDGLEWEDHNGLPPCIGERVDLEREGDDNGSNPIVYRVVDVRRWLSLDSLAKGVADMGCVYVTLRRECCGTATVRTPGGAS